MKRKHLSLEDKSKVDEENQEGSFQENNLTAKSIDWKGRHYDMCIERDMCFHKHTELEKTHKLETENATKAIKSHQDEKKELSMKI